MKSGTRDTLCGAELLALREAHFARMEALFDGGTPARAFTLDGVRGQGASDPYVTPERWEEQT